MKYLIPFILGLFLIAPVSAGYTVTWIAPTENTDNSELTDLDGFKLWCLKAANTYGNPAILPATDRKYVKDWAGPGDWKCKMRAFNTAGTDSADSVEVFFTLVDLDGDGNGHIGGDIQIVVPGFPDVTVICPVAETGACRKNVLDITRKGYFTITGPDGLPVQTPPGDDQRERQTTSVLEAIEWITKDGRVGVFIINTPNYEVSYD